MSFVLVPAGEFIMGSPASEEGREAQEVEHRVRITRPFYLGETEVTQAQWAAVMGDNPSWFAACGPGCPVENVSWDRVQTFLERLNERHGATFRLPREAEWEYACRAGSTTAFHTGANLSPRQAVIDAQAPAPVGSFTPNAWGLFDLHGNVWEWTEDEFCPYPAGGATDPMPHCQSPLRVIRGGSWHYGADSARCALRYTHRPQDDGFSLGFRVAIDARAVVKML